MDQGPMDPLESGYTPGGFGTDVEPSHTLPNFPPSWDEIDVGPRYWDVMLSQSTIIGGS